MKRAVEFAGGGTLGLLAGALLCAPLAAYGFSPTPVTWSGSSCPPGIYTITTTATSADGSRSFMTSSQNVQLPQLSVVQEFPDLPAGEYQVSATVTDSLGAVFGSDVQMVAGLGSSRVPPERLPRTPRSSDTSSASLQAVPGRAAASPRGPAPHASTLPPVVDSPAIRLPERMAKWLADASLRVSGTAAPAWKRLDVIDSDKDGVMDVVRIEWANGDVLVARFER
jgi:hypothetical protein